MSAQAVIIGAGMAGITCARTLAGAGWQVRVLDKGRGIGGRLATRRAEGGLQFDHGAPCLEAVSDEFADVLDGLGTACAAWPDAAGRVGVPGMSALPRIMARGLDVAQGKEVCALAAVQDGWRIICGDDEIITRHLVLAIPAPQAVALLGAAHPLAPALQGVEMAPCLTLMAAFDKAPARAPAPAGPFATILRDSAKPGRPGGTGAWVAHATRAWSEAHLEQGKDEIAARLLPALCAVLGTAPEAARYASAHRWRYARAAKPLGAPFLCDEEGRLHVGGDWCLGPTAEDAWRSGAAMARDLLERGDAG